MHVALEHTFCELMSYLKEYTIYTHNQVLIVCEDVPEHPPVHESHIENTLHVQTLRCPPYFSVVEP